MAKKKLPGEPPPERPFGQNWPRDRDPVPRKTTKAMPTVPAESWAKRARRLFWRRMLRPFFIWTAQLIKRACDELLVFSFKLAVVMLIVAVLGGSIITLKNYSLRQVVDFVVVNLSKQHGIETGSIEVELTEPKSTEDWQTPVPRPAEPPRKHVAPPAVVKRRSMPPKERPWFDRMIDEIDEALGWKKG